MKRLMASTLWKSFEQHTLAAPLLRRAEYPWHILEALRDFICAVGQALPEDEYEQIRPDVWAARTAHIDPSAHLGSPCIIGHDTEIRHGAFIRGSALIGDGAVVGNSSELKNCILFDRVQVPHFNYIGDSILGFRAHLGAGAITSNVKSDKSDVVIHMDCTHISTDRRKLGALLGDGVEVGCNSVLNPGTVIGARSTVYPCVSVRGYVGEDCIYKGGGVVVKRRRKG